MTMLYQLIRVIYSLVFIIALPFILLKNLWRSRLSSGYRKRTLERFGFCPFKLKNPIWIHSVSMGETIAIAPLVKKLINQYPKKPFLITTMSVTGSNQVQQIYKDNPQVHHCYLPYDIPRFLRIFLKRTQPKCLIIMETELWPNLIYLCNKKRIPVMLTNARLSEKSKLGYQKIAYFIKPMLNQLTLIAAQNHADSQRFLSLKFPKEKLYTTGNLKYDIQVTEKAHHAGLLLKQTLNNRPVWIAASTHQGEDEIIINAHQIILEQIPNALLILVPRHPERFDSVNILLEKSFKTIRRSSHKPVTDETTVYLGDTMGEMMILFSASDIAFIGGSLVQRGGHNLLEPAALKLPVLSGQSTFNFAEITQSLLNNSALVIVTNAQSLANTIIDLFHHPLERQMIGKRAYETVLTNQGALEKQFNLATQLIQLQEN